MLTPSKAAQSLLDGRRTFRYVSLFRIDRLDGAIFRFTDHDAPVDFPEVSKGTPNRYTPVGGFDASAFRRESALRIPNRQFIGVITSNAITTQDLQAGRYRSAKITERIVDWRYPWAGAIQTNYYRVTSVQFDGEAWQAEVEGMA